MLTSSIVLVMIVNTVAASTAAFVALLASAVDPSHRVATTDVAKGPARIPDSLRTKRMESPMQQDGHSRRNVFFGWRSAASGRVRNHYDEPDGELLRRMT